MKTINSIFLLLFSVNVSADICFTITEPGTFPRPELKVKETYFQTMPHPTLGGNAVLLAWPVIARGEICCNVSQHDGASWHDMLTAARRPTARPITEVAASFPPLPWSSRAREAPWAVQACREAVNTMVTDGVVIPYRVVRNTNRPDGSRQMYVLNAVNVRVPLMVNGAPVYAEAGRICEEKPITSRTSAGWWLYVTNSAGVRGITLCK